MQPINILGVGRTDYDPKPGIAIPEMVHFAVQAALADAGLTMKDVDARVTASADLWDGLTASNVAITEVVGAVMQPEARVAGDGLLAACHGAMSILAEAYNVVLVIAHCKSSMGDFEAITNWTYDPIYQQPLGLDDVAASALQASILSLPSPLPRPLADGAAAIILSRTLSLHTPHLIGMGWALDEHYLGDRDLTDSPALREALAALLRLQTSTTQNAISLLSNSRIILITNASCGLPCFLARLPKSHTPRRLRKSRRVACRRLSPG